MSTRPSLRWTVLLLALTLHIACTAPCAAQEPDWLLSTAAEQLVNEPIGAAMKRRAAIEVRSQSGFDHRGRGCLPGSWTPVTVWSRNNTDQPVYATVKLATLTSEGTQNGSRVQIPVLLPPHRIVTTRSVVWVAPSDTRLDVQVVAGTGETGQDTQALLAPGNFKRAFVVIGTTHTGPDARVRAYPHDDIARGGTDARTLPAALPLAGQLLPDYTERLASNRWMVFHPVLETLPDRWIAYTAVRAVVVSDPGVIAQLTQAQWDAILTYARSGGHLVIEVDGRPAIDALEVPRLRDVFPARTAEPESLTPGSIFEDVREFSRTIPTVPLTARSADARTVKFAGRPLMVSARLGLGMVTGLGFSLGATELIKSESAYPGLVRRLLDEPVKWPIDALRQTDAVETTRQLEMTIKSEQLDQIPSHRVLLMFLAGYCLLVSPLGRALAERSRRPLAVWWMLPLVVLAFIVIANTKLSIQRPQFPMLREVGVVQARDGDQTGLWRAYLNMYSPEQSVYRVDTTPETTLGYLTFSDHRGLNRDVLAYADGMPSGQPHQGSPPEEDPRTRRFGLDELPLAPRSTTALEAVAPVALGAGITVEERGNACTIVNGTPVDLERGLVRTRGNVRIEVPALRAGATVTVTAPSDSHRSLSGGSRDERVIDRVVDTVLATQSRPVFIGVSRKSAGTMSFSAPGVSDLVRTAFTLYVIHPRSVSQ